MSLFSGLVWQLILRFKPPKKAARLYIRGILYPGRTHPPRRLAILPGRQLAILVSLLLSAERVITSMTAKSHSMATIAGFDTGIHEQILSFRTCF
jgi:hypothetical protein